MPRNVTAFRTLFAIAGFAALPALAACNGWPRAPELSTVQKKPEKYPTYAAAPAEPAPFEFAGRHWVVSPNTTELIGAKLQTAGTAGNVTVYAPAGEQAPYTVLYAPAGGTKWRRVVPID